MKKFVPVILCALIFLSMFFAGGYLQSIFASGMTINSISLAYPPVEGQLNEWIVSASVTGWGQSIFGNLDKTNINYDGVSASYPLSITGKVTENKGFYLIDNSNPKSIYEYRVTEKHGVIHDYYVYVTADPAPPCDGMPIYEIITQYPTGFLQLTSQVDVMRACIYKHVIGTAAPISGSPNLYPTVEVTVDVKNQPQTVTLVGSSAYSLPNGLGSVAWTNSPVEAQSLGAISFGNAYVGVHPISSTEWRAVKRNDYEGGGADQSWSDSTVLLDAKYNNYVSDGLDITKYGCDLSTLAASSECIKTALQNDAGVSNGLADRLTNTAERINNWYTTYDELDSNIGFMVNLNNVYVSTPELQFRIKSEWIGIDFPNGAPLVTSASGSPKPFKSGEPLTASISVKNIGDGTGNFVVQNIVCGNLQKLAQIYPVTVSPGATETITFSMGTTGAASDSGTCSGKIVDTGSLKSSTWSFQYEMVEPAECIEGKTYVFGNVIKICVGGKLVDSEICAWGVVTDEFGNWVCAEAPGETRYCELEGRTINQDEWTAERCEKPPFDMTMLLIVVVGLLTFLIIGKQSLIDKEIVGVLIAAIVGGLSSYLLWWISNNLVEIGLFAILGGASLYLFGGIFVTIAIIVGSIIKGVRGK